MMKNLVFAALILALFSCNQNSWDLNADTFPPLKDGIAVQAHGGRQYADYRAVLTNAKRGYATIGVIHC